MLIELYLNELRKVRDIKTVLRKEQALRHFEYAYDYYPTFDRSELFRFYEVLKNKGLSDSTIRLIFEEIRRFYKWLRDKGYSVEFSNEALKETFRGKNKGYVRKYYSDDEVEIMLKAVMGHIEGISVKPPIYYLLITFLLSTGLRISEAVNAKKNDIHIRRVLSQDGNEKELWFIRVQRGKFGKARETPMIFFEETWRTLWMKHLNRLKAEDFIFTYSLKYPSGKTKTLRLRENTAQRFFWNLSKELKHAGYDLKITAHRFRYTFITRLATMGMPVNIVSEWVGHSRTSTTMNVYMQVEQEKAIELLTEKL